MDNARAGELRSAVIEAVWRAVDPIPYVRSATLAGSFSTGLGLEGIADLDTIVIVDLLDAARFAELQERFRAELEPVLAACGYALGINPTLGPLKFNEPQTAVLHLMVYSAAAHREHAVKSPFTCLDWQRSGLWRKAAMESVYAVFGLQPHHFISARRGARDYLHDLVGGVVTYRELCFDAGGYREVQRRKPMTPRDRHEFAYHVMRFLMQNFLKLVRRRNEVDDGQRLLSAYFDRFPEGAGTFAGLFRELVERKASGRFEPPTPELTGRVTAFVEAFESQFREAFERRATRHLVFRHAPTRPDPPSGDAVVFEGRSDPGLPAGEPAGLDRLAATIEGLGPREVHVSPLQRAAASLGLLARRAGGLPAPVADRRLAEIDYGRCEGLTVAEVRRRHPELFAAWERGEDPAFPGGENTASVLDRVRSFAAARWEGAQGPSVTCTHNVVLRCLVGDLLNVPSSRWYRIRIPHLAPIRVVATERFGLFVDLDEDVEREMFAE